ncbi:hypothetical protein TRP8649_01398 [Pelagimonas phthalicica]|uniref:Phage tail fibre protein N-terminal domain-containing protein n=1 Tax=Pelagimonas phthalicica TaxID=1037362 RepID=A0A238JA72_9RHOB|nr:phage tail protein [Pelagimonas phthalicica]TDS94180.1 tail-collar fiber protein [Pelagimonas phthalicica]SMX27295.1 hypothetical protein TRP8649_01398 [Pelagimonas phthalicica]
MTDGVDIYTNLGLRKIRDAAGTANKVKIKFIALGDAAGVPYAPEATQTGLRRERLRTEIERHYPVGDNAWYVKAVFPSGSTEITVREMGFFDEDGDLIALWAGTDVGNGRGTGPHEYLIQHALDFRAVESGLIMIDAPLDDYIDHAVLKLTTDAIQTELLLKQAKKFRDIEVAA